MAASGVSGAATWAGSAMGNAACGLGTAVQQDVVQPVTQFGAPAVQDIQQAPAAIEQSPPVQYARQAAAPVVQAVQRAPAAAEQAVQQAPAEAQQALSSAGATVQQDVVQPAEQAVSGASDYVQNTVAPVVQQAPAVTKQALDTVTNALPQGLGPDTSTLFGAGLCTVPVPGSASGVFSSGSYMGSGALDQAVQAAPQAARNVLDSAGRFLGDPGGAVATMAATAQEAAGDAVDETVSLIQQVAPEAIQVVSPQLTMAAQVAGSVGSYIAAQTGDPSSEPILSPDNPILQTAHGNAPNSPGGLWNWASSVGDVGGQTYVPPSLDDSMRAQGVDPDFVRGAVSQALNPAFLPGGPGVVAFQGATEVAGHVLGPVAGKVAGAAADALRPALGGVRELAGDAVDRAVGLVQQALGPVTDDGATDPLAQIVPGAPREPYTADAAPGAPSGGGGQPPPQAGAAEGGSEPLLTARLGISPDEVKQLPLGTPADVVRELLPKLMDKANEAGVAIQIPDSGIGGYRGQEPEGALAIPVVGTSNAIHAFAEGAVSLWPNEESDIVTTTGEHILRTGSAAHVTLVGVGAEERAVLHGLATEMSPEGWQTDLSGDGTRTFLSISGLNVSRYEMDGRVQQWTALLRQAGYRVESAGAEPADVELVFQPQAEKGSPHGRSGTPEVGETEGAVGEGGQQATDFGGDGGGSCEAGRAGQAPTPQDGDDRLDRDEARALEAPSRRQGQPSGLTWAPIRRYGPGAGGAVAGGVRSRVGARPVFGGRRGHNDPVGS